MSRIRRAALPALPSFGLVGCVGLPANQPLKCAVAAAVQPMDVQVGFKQQALYAQFELSTSGSAAAGACGALPGIGILLAAACDGVAGAMDASVNASRAKTADEFVRPLKDAIVDLSFDQLVRDVLIQTLSDPAGTHSGTVAVTKKVEDKAYEQAFRASAAGGVFFINVDDHLSKDFSTLEISTRSQPYPRSAAARTAAGLPAEVPAEDALSWKSAAYRNDVHVVVEGAGRASRAGQAGRASCTRCKGRSGRRH